MTQKSQHNAHKSAMQNKKKMMKKATTQKTNKKQNDWSNGYERQRKWKEVKKKEVKPGCGSDEFRWIYSMKSVKSISSPTGFTNNVVDGSVSDSAVLFENGVILNMV